MIDTRRGDQSVPTSTQTESSENLIPEIGQAIAEGAWTQTQQRLLEVLQQKEYRFASIAKICQIAGYSGNTAWYQAMKEERFAAVVQALGIHTWSSPKLSCSQN